MCGGTSKRYFTVFNRRGLSPRVRGNLGARGAIPGASGSIPACAGEPSRPTLGLNGRGVYPRVCGGTATVVTRAVSSYGLSPRVRGNHRVAAFQDAFHRSIPACAGEPVQGVACAVACKVYPRVCGGTDGSGQRRRKLQGLSPRVRGNLGSKCVKPRLKGSIPACAGEPAGQGQNGLQQSVYPRVCGGTANPSYAKADPPGLSPRVRGNHEWVRYLQSENRSIPACAGEPARQA